MRILQVYYLFTKISVKTIRKTYKIDIQLNKLTKTC
jgi:hypothetical protein